MTEIGRVELHVCLTFFFNGDIDKQGHLSFRFMYMCINEVAIYRDVIHSHLNRWNVFF